MASTKREKELARQRAERQAARRMAAAQRKKQRNAVIASVVAVVLVAVGVTGAVFALRGTDEPSPVAASDTTSPTPAAEPSDAASPTSSTPPSEAPSAAPSKARASAKPAGDPGCSYEKSDTPAAKQVKLPPTEGVETKQVYLVTLTTNRGDIVFEMNSAKAPCTANNLRSLAHFTYFDNTPCHRLTTQSIRVLQCGDPTGKGTGGPGYTFDDENLKGAKYPRGTVAMANGGPGTNGSQFFLVYGESTLQPNYTPFGKVVQGLEILDEIAKGGSDESYGVGDGKPKTAVTIKTLRARPKAV